MRGHTINVSFLALFFISIISSVVIISLLAKMLPLVVSKTIFFCQQFISSALFQIPHTLPNAFILTPAVVLGIGILSFLVQLIKTKRLVGRLFKKRIQLRRKVENLVESCDLKNRVYLVEDNNLFSFCVGIFSPSIIITTALTQSLNDQELEAVLLHEKSHLKNLDPLKILFGKTISSMFFFLPIFRELSNNMNATNEILADRFTVDSQQQTSYLRNALRKIIANPRIQFATVPAISNPDCLEIRVHRLVNPTIKHNLGVSMISIITSVAFFIASWFILQAPVNAFQMESDGMPSYFMCSADNACSQECHRNAQSSAVSDPSNLFSKEPNISSSPQTTKYNLP